MQDRNLQSNCPAVAETKEISRAELQIILEGCGIVCRLLKTERAVRNISGVPVSLLLECNYLPCACQLRQNEGERCLDCIAATMQQHYRRAGRIRSAMDLIIKTKAVDRGIPGCHICSFLVGRTCCRGTDAEATPGFVEDKNNPQPTGCEPTLGDHATFSALVRVRRRTVARFAVRVRLPQEAARMLQELIVHVRQDVDVVEEPRFPALLERTAEVLGGLQKAFAYYREGTEKTWRRK